MPRSTSSVQTELAVIDAHLASANAFVQSAGSRGTELSYADYSKLTARRDQLQSMLDVANGDAPMFVRGVVHGLH